MATYPMTSVVILDHSGDVLKASKREVWCSPKSNPFSHPRSTMASSGGSWASQGTFQCLCSRSLTPDSWASTPRVTGSVLTYVLLTSRVFILVLRRQTINTN